jgi:hypothetical protein
MSVEISPAGIRCRWLIADDVRTEMSGKNTIVGLYADDMLVVEMPESAPNPTAQSPLGLEGISILCSVSGFVGTIDGDFLVTREGIPTDQVERVKVQLQASTLFTTVSMIFRIRPFLVGVFGPKEARLTLPKLKRAFSHTFYVHRRNQGEASPHQGKVVIETADVSAERKSPSKRKTSSAKLAPKKSDGPLRK